MSDKLAEALGRLRQLEEELRSDPDPDVKAWAREVEELRRYLEQPADSEPQQKFDLWGRIKETGKYTPQIAALAKILFDLIHDGSKDD